MDKKLQSALKKSPEAFLLQSLKINSKSEKSSLKTFLWSCTPRFSSSLPSHLLHLISQSVESFKNPSDPVNDSSENEESSQKRLRRSSRQTRNLEDNSNPNLHSRKQILFKNLHICAYITHLCISHPQKAFSIPDLLPCAQILHDNLVLYEYDPVLQSEIATLCEHWWKEGLPGRETLIAQSLPYLLSKSLSLGKKSDVHRIYTIREAFTLFDFVDESIEDLKLLLVRCVVSPLYLKTEEGRKFIAFLFGLNSQLVKEALAIIRSQIPFGRKSILEAYGDIVFRAWKSVGVNSRDEIENSFVQGFIEGAIHAPTRALAAHARRVLGGFISQRTTEGVEKLLFVLSEPVLFRSLQAANSNVRQNALLLLVDMFPLENPDATKEVKDTLLDKQFFLLDKLLIDDCPSVRVVAVEGSCRILRLFWEVVPSSAITKILEKIVNVVSCDVCSEVRLAVLNGVIYLLGNAQTHEVLKVLLPRLGHMFHDPNLSIRVAVSDLLLGLRDIHTFQFNKVVGLDALLSSLANDHPLVAQRLTRLLIPSYFPSKVPMKEACSRCIVLIKRSHAAGARFCEFALSEGSSPKSLLELVRVLVCLILSPNDLCPEIDGFFVAATKLCCSLSSEATCKTALNALFSGEKIKSLFLAANTIDARSSVLSIASMFSPADESGLLEHCMELVTNCGNLSENTERQAEVRAAHKLILSSGRFNELVETITNLLKHSASGNHVAAGSEKFKQSVPCKKKKKVMPVKHSMKSHLSNGKKSLNVEGDLLVAEGAAWQIKDLLTSIDTRKSLLRSPILGLTFSALEVICQMIVEQCLRCESMCVSAVLAYTALAMHMSLQNIDLVHTNENRDDSNNELGSRRSLLELTAMEHSLNHLYNSTEKLLGTRDLGKTYCPSSELQHEHKKKLPKSQKSKRSEAQADISNPIEADSESKSDIPQGKVISNIVKIATTILKCTVDATDLGLVSSKQERRCLQFASVYVQYINSVLETHPNHNVFKDEDLKETLICLRSSFTYSVKLLNLILANSGNSGLIVTEASGLANLLLDLIALTESYLGSRHTERLITVAKPWLPDLILALSSPHILTDNTQEEEGLSNVTSPDSCHFPAWLIVLGKVELSELSEEEQPEEVADLETFPVFKKFMETVILLLKKGNPRILDGMGVVILMGLASILKKGEFGLVLGLVHFVCVKLVGHEGGKCEELDLVMCCLREILLQIERELNDDSRASQDGKPKLESAKALLESVCMHHE